MNHNYNIENMPTSVTSGSKVVEYTYDGNGQRVKKTSGDSTRLYIGKLYECPSSDFCGRYIYAGDTLIAVKDSQSLRYHHGDHLGSTKAVTDSAGNKIESIDYYPFGESRADTGTENVNHKYTSQEFDYEIGLYNYNARLYDPELGRFVSADSIVPNPTDPQSFNRYSYVLNNPLLYTDPTGHRRRSWHARDWLGAAEIVVGAVLATVGAIATGCTDPYLCTSGAALMAHGVDNLGGEASVPPQTIATVSIGSSGDGNSSGGSSGSGSSSSSTGGIPIGNTWITYVGPFSGNLNYSSTSSYNYGQLSLGYGGIDGNFATAANLSSNPFSLLDKVLTTGNAIAVVGLGLSTAALVVPSTSAAAPFIAVGGAITSIVGVGWSAYQYSHGDASLAQHSVNGGLAAASLTTSFLPAPAGPFLNVLMRSLDVSNSAVGAFK